MRGMVVHRTHLCDECGFSWKPKGLKPGHCPNCSSKKIAPSNVEDYLGIDNLDQ